MTRLLSDFARYDIESDVEGMAKALASHAEMSAASFARHHFVSDIPYGPGPAERIDMVMPAGGASEIVVYLHGGFWKAGRKEGRAYLADGILARGYGFANVEYPLAPGTSLDRIVESAERALALLYRIAGQERRLLITGNSAGGHLASVITSLESLARTGVPSEAISGLISISGVHDVRPMMEMPPRDWLGIDEPTAARLSPVLMSYASDLPVLLSIGGEELPGFFDQLYCFEAKLSTGRQSVTREVYAGEDHLSVIARLPEMIDSIKSRIS